MINRKAFCQILVLSVAFSLLGTVSQTAAQSKQGIELYNTWQYQEAEKVFREELKADPNNTPANFYLGLTVLGQEKYKDALDLFVRVYKSQQRADQRTRSAVPSEYQIQLAMAQARIGLKQYADAWKNLESARIEDGSASDVYVYRGLYYLEQDKIKEAEKELEKAIALDGKNPYAYYYAGLAHHKAGNPQRAVEDLKMFLQLAPNAPEAPKAKLLHDQLC
jgi:cytochrome c-type biogenesis protein CcmH/NrfG